MIYAFRCLGAPFIKFGRAEDVGRRLSEIAIGCPHVLELAAYADWPDSIEPIVHLYLSESHHRGEWFSDSDKTATVIACMQNSVEGLTLFEEAFRMGHPDGLHSRARRIAKRRAKLRLGALAGASSSQDGRDAAQHSGVWTLVSSGKDVSH